jgi:hypothetical protein
MHDKNSNTSKSFEYVPANATVTIENSFSMRLKFLSCTK